MSIRDSCWIGLDYSLTRTFFVNFETSLRIELWFHFCQVFLWFIKLLLLGGITARVGTNGDPDHVAGTGRRLGLVQAQGPNTVTTAEVAVRAGVFDSNIGICILHVCPACLLFYILLIFGLYIFLSHQGAKEKEWESVQKESKQVC